MPLDLASLLSPPRTGISPYDVRHGGIGVKGKGFFGPIAGQGGQTSTEISTETDDIGEHPLIVPTLDAEELNLLLRNEKPTDAIYRKAYRHAKERLAAGKSPFAEPGELRRPLPEGFLSLDEMLKQGKR